MDILQTYTPKQLRSAVESGGIQAVTIAARGARFYIEIKSRTGHGVLTKSRSRDPRTFTNPGQALTVLRRLGVHSGGFDTTGWTPEQREARLRPDRAEAMKQMHEAAAHDQWFREQVREGLAEAADPAAEWVDHSVVEADIEAQRARIKAEMGKTN
jgi:hypothetical protein